MPRLDRQTKLSIRAALLIAVFSLAIGGVQGCGVSWRDVVAVGVKIGRCVADQVDPLKFLQGDAGTPPKGDAGDDTPSPPALPPNPYRGDAGAAE